MVHFKKTAIIGVGLLGASLALSLREENICTAIIGSGRTEKNLIEAKKRGIVDSYAREHAEACKDADLIVLATPVGSFHDIISEIKNHIAPGSIVIDVGSTKSDCIKHIESEIPEGAFFVGSHPITGSDRSGITAATASLFRDALCIITPTDKTTNESLNKVEQLWEQVGARVVKMTPEEHDRVFSSVSHLPHMAASAIVKTVADIDKSDIYYAGQGFRDTTRIAMSSPELWVDICRSNRQNIIEHIDILLKNLESIKTMLKENDYESLRSFLNTAMELRKTIE